ncbi:methyltransferase domain-containing protein [Azospirillum doebereinerae]
MTDEAYRYQEADSVLLAWERGVWEPSPPPPAVHSAAYRRTIVGLFKGLWTGSASPSLLSLGCGNAMVEVELSQERFDVLATDYAGAAVALAAGKGLKAEILDVLAPPVPSRLYDFVYADGLLGHMAVQPQGVERLAATMATFAGPGARIVMAHELADGGEAVWNVTGHAGSRFYRPPPDEAWQLLSSCLPGWRRHSVDIAHYIRPARGPRRREILVLTQ